jgi:tetratricopeptide (TPR) repeat protein
MFGFLKRFFYSIPKKKRPESAGGESTGELWNADFSKPNRVRFDIKSESSYHAYLHRHSLVLGLKTTNCLAWIDVPDYRYRDQIIKAQFRLDRMGGYAAAGLLFRMVEEGTYYLALVSSKCFFRLDVVRNNMPFPLIGWTEIPAPPSGAAAPGSRAVSAETPVTLEAAAYGSHLVLAINGLWAAELSDASLFSGGVGFALASYEGAPIGRSGPGSEYAARVFLEAFSVESRISEVTARYDYWTEKAPGSAESRFRLAETFAAMREPAAALSQLKKSWEERCAAQPEPATAQTPDQDAASQPGEAEESPDPAYPGNQRELLLAARLALRLERYSEAEAYAAACLALDRDSPEGREAITEKAKILYGAEQFSALRDYAADAISGGAHDPVLHTLLGHAYWNLAEYEKAAAAYDRAFELDGENGLLAKHAANVYEVLGRREEALARYLAGGRVFLGQDNYQDLGILAPKILALGADSHEAHALVGKWAYGIEDWVTAEAEFIRAEELRNARKPKPPKDPAVSYLRGLMLIRAGKRREAFPFLEEAARFAPDFGLFQFRLAENRYLLSGNADDPRLSMDLEAALRLIPDDGWVHNLAAQVHLAKGDLEKAAEHLKKAVAALGEVPAIRVNRAVLAYLRGSLHEALGILEAARAEDPGGLLANCGGNLLVRSGDYEKADAYYRQALAIAPDNLEYLTNRASCLIKLEYYGQADELLARAHSKAPSPEILELISHVASRKGEFARAESASKAALDMDATYVPSLLSLGWFYCSTGRWDEARQMIRRLENIGPGGEAAERLGELRRRTLEGTTRLVACASCGRDWRVPRDPPPSPPIRLYAMPPDDFPAGTCPSCGGTWCIGCAKEHLDTSGRFLCPDCGKTLKLINEGLKKIVADWAASTIPKTPQ